MARYLISEAARQTGVEAHVLRYWEEELELEIPRNELGHRYYTEEHIEIFNHIKEMKAEGYQLKAIKESLAQAAAARREKLSQDRAVGEEHMGEHMGAAEREISSRQDREREEREPEARRQEDGQTAVLTKKDEELAAQMRKERIVEFESIVYDIVTEALRNNNERLGREVSDRVGDKVVKEMNYLMRENEEQMEEHFRKLDDALTRRRKKLKPVKAEKETAVTKVTRLPVVSQTKKRRRLFHRRRKTTIY